MGRTTIRDFDASQGGPLYVRGITKITANPSANVEYPQGVLLVARSAGNVVVRIEDGSTLTVTGMTSGNYLTYGSNPALPVIVYEVLDSGTTLTAYDAVSF